jgi:hypothetical protein
MVSDCLSSIIATIARPPSTQLHPGRSAVSTVVTTGATTVTATASSAGYGPHQRKGAKAGGASSNLLPAEMAATSFKPRGDGPLATQHGPPAEERPEIVLRHRVVSAGRCWGQVPVLGAA